MRAYIAQRHVVHTLFIAKVPPEQFFAQSKVILCAFCILRTLIETNFDFLKGTIVVEFDSMLGK